ncbi:hypothetical protein NDU88_007386 [Pleurodeles waltl]|uniref:Uncharacterized protein n=1 Tax=Pleurodeles waltl TaxID=8319 RepID=A0AAV7WHH6_PLEWA|nr:hypothetical protein NDU88_007386 [Pleurodeles waltl]
MVRPMSQYLDIIWTPEQGSVQRPKEVIGLWELLDPGPGPEDEPPLCGEELTPGQDMRKDPWTGVYMYLIFKKWDVLES